MTERLWMKWKCKSNVRPQCDSSIAVTPPWFSSRKSRSFAVRHFSFLIFCHGFTDADGRAWKDNAANHVCIQKSDKYQILFLEPKKERLIGIFYLGALSSFKISATHPSSCQGQRFYFLRLEVVNHRIKILYSGIFIKQEIDIWLFRRINYKLIRSHFDWADSTQYSSWLVLDSLLLQYHSPLFIYFTQAGIAVATLFSL